MLHVQGLQTAASNVRDGYTLLWVLEVRNVSRERAGRRVGILLEMILKGEASRPVPKHNHTPELDVNSSRR
jgi:hypothetical protein